MKNKTKTSSSKSKEKKETKKNVKKNMKPSVDNIEEDIETNNNFNILRVNCIENIPSSIEDIFTIKELNLLALCRSDNTIEIWTTNSWVQLFKFPGLKNIQTRKIWIISKNFQRLYYFLTISPLLHSISNIFPKKFFLYKYSISNWK